MIFHSGKHRKPWQFILNNVPCIHRNGENWIRRWLSVNIDWQETSLKGTQETGQLYQFLATSMGISSAEGSTMLYPQIDVWRCPEIFGVAPRSYPNLNHYKK
jgi:hypothetical protein